MAECWTQVLQRFHEATSLQNAQMAISQARVSRPPINSGSVACFEGWQASTQHCTPWHRVPVLWVQASAAACGHRARLPSNKTLSLRRWGSCSQLLRAAQCP